MITVADIILAGIPLEDKSVDFVLTDLPYDLSRDEQTFVHKEFLRVCRGDILVFSPPENQWVFPELSRYLFWIKPTSTKNFSRNYGRFVEMLFLYKRSSTWNNSLHWSNYTGVYDDKVIGHSTHPHEKPLSLLERFILLHTNLNDIVLDPFCGSGTTLIAAQRCKRRAIGFDIDLSNVLTAQKTLKEE